MDTFLAHEVQLAGRLQIGRPENSIRSNLETPEQLDNFRGNLRGHTRQLTVVNTADCMDDRPTVRLGNGTTDPAILMQRVVHQLPGGLYLATTKAVVAANAAIVRDAKNFNHAYELVGNVLAQLKYEDAGHAGCGASKFVEQSAAEPVSAEIVLPTLGAIMAVDDSRRKAFDLNAETKRQRLEDGFYGSWTSAWHEEHLQTTVPHNFSFLTEVHNADGVYLITSPNAGFAKNAFQQETGQESFAVTVPKMAELAHQLGGTAEERDRILMGFGADLLDVSDKLIVPGMPAFTDK